MTFNTFITNVLYTFLTAILPLITVYAVNFLKSKIAAQTAKMENEQLKYYINNALDAIGKSVLMVNQTYVDSLKASGTFDSVSQTTAKELAIAQARELISIESQNAIEIVYGDFEKYLNTAIEAMVKERKE